MANPLLPDREIAFQLHEVLDAGALARLPRFADHGRETFEAWVDVCRRFARQVLWPTYRPMDASPPRLEDGRVKLHPAFHDAWAGLTGLGVIAADRSFAVGGQQLPLTVATAGNLYLQAGNPSVYALAGLTAGAAHLLEAFGSEGLKERWLAPLHDGRFTGTMALTEPQAGSSLADVSTRATPDGDGFRLSGSKIFISGGDHDLGGNVVHMVLARIDGAPPGIRGVSLFLVPRQRPAGGGWEDNDVRVTGMVHKIGWRGLPSVVLSLGEAGDCRGWLVGEPHRGVAQMFQMMNEARLMVGAHGVATASVAYQESLAYARERVQGRPVGARDPLAPPVPIVQHADVRRMLLRQKAVVEGGLSLLLEAAWLADHAAHAPEEGQRRRAALLLDLLTPVAKSFPAERGYESNVLALQIHGGYGYSSEYPVEAFLRDQKLNSIHEGTTGIQGLDLLGRKVVAGGGEALRALLEEVERSCRRAARAGVEPAGIEAVRQAGATVAELTLALGTRGLAGDVEGMTAHSADYLELFSTWVVAWRWLEQAAAAREGLARDPGPADEALYRGKLQAARYWWATELPRVAALAALCRDGDDSYLAMRDGWY